MKTAISLVGLLLGVGLLVTLPVAVGANDLIAAKTVNGTTYLNGGVGKEDVAAMRHVAREYPLRMTFSEGKDDEFLVNVPVMIFDMHGKQVFELADAGPMLYVKLPNGKYKVNARLNGQTESREIRIAGHSGKNLYFHWNPDKPKA